MNEIDKKIKISNKIYPYISGLSDDLLFWAAINTIFLITVKMLSASQVSLLSAIAGLVTILSQSIVLKIIKRIGNIKSVRLGLLMLLIGSTLITFGNNFSIIMVGEIFYNMAFLFKGMDSIILRRNLKYLKREDDFIKIQNRSSMIYAIATMICSFIAGYIFNINNYLPMILCIVICFLNIVFSSLLYEVESKEEINQYKSKAFKWTKVLFLIVLAFGLLYGTLETAQENGKIFMQYFMQNNVSLEKTAIYLSIIIAFSRVSRVISDLVFNKIYNKLKNKFIILLNVILILAISFIIAVSFVYSKTVAMIIMGLGFCMILWARDPIMNFLKNALLDNCSKETQQTAMLKFNLSRRIVRCILATLVSLILLKVDVFYIMILFLVLALIYLNIILKLYKMLSTNSNKLIINNIN